VTNIILSRFQHEPALLGVTTRAWFESCVEQASALLASIENDEVKTQASDSFWFADDDYRKAYRPYSVQNGILRIPVKGVLLNGFPWQLGSFATGYEYISAAMKRGIEDEDVKGIALIIDSPGGMVAGNFDLSDRMFGMRGKKPIKAFAAESAYSAAYSIASAADEIVVTRSGGVGSVGVVTMHVDFSEALSKEGVKVTYIYAGKHKVDGNPYEPLPEGVRARIRERIDASYDEFVGIVARNRGIEEKAVRKTEASIFDAKAALEVKFADRIGALDDEITAFTASFTKEEDDDMADTKAQTFTESDVANARSEGVAEGHKAGVKAAMDRITAIMASDAGKERPKAALNAAMKTSMPADEAVAFLATLPEEKAEAPKADDTPKGAGAPAGMFEAAMDGTQTQLITAGGQPQKSQADQDRDLILGFGLPGFKSAKKEG
jgi:signal peptide peptidase SppA